ncbi:MAG: GNAT family N-acetyltransferase [Butyrivibrio sp.]|nr:GNAT family N-acetyltransferase [Butyrivibrio sp.]
MALAWKTFMEYNAPGYSLIGISNFKNFINDDVLHKMFIMGNYQLMVARKKDGQLIGMLTLRDRNHISLLFVDGEYHKNGVGKALLRFASMYVRDEEGLNKLTVHSSPYAVDFYHRLGFKDIKGEIVQDGIRITPMELNL